MWPLVLGPEEDVGDGGFRVGNVSEGREGSVFAVGGDELGEDEEDASGDESEGEYVGKGGDVYEIEVGIGETEPEALAFDLDLNLGGLRCGVESFDEGRGDWPSQDPRKLRLCDLLIFRPSTEDVEGGVLGEPWSTI
jgi:hypothetical protein